MQMTVTKMSSKGQIVIPLDIRKELGLHEGELFTIVGEKDSIILKRFRVPSRAQAMKELGRMAREQQKKLEAKGLTEQDVINIALRRGKPAPENRI